MFECENRCDIQQESISKVTPLSFARNLQKLTFQDAIFDAFSNLPQVQR